MGAQSVTNHALSGLYNVAYYCGMAEELGGSRAFSEEVGSVAR